MSEIILINPPVTKPSEPPAGLARLCGALRARGIVHAAVDLNIEGLLHLMGNPGDRARNSGDKWTARALKNHDRNLALVRGAGALRNFDSYKKAVLELDRLVSRSHPLPGINLGLADYENKFLSPLSSADLLGAARDHENNPFFPFFRERLSGLLKQTRYAGISVNYLSQALSAFAIAGYIRAGFPEVKIIMGGGLVTSWLGRGAGGGPKLASLFGGLVEHFVGGPGEGELLSILGRQSSGEVFLPDYSPFPLAQYLVPGPVLPYSTASGCWWRKCSFCPEKAEGSRYAPLPPGRALAEVRGLCETEKPALVHFLDSALSPAFLERIIEEPPGVPWYGFARVEPRLVDAAFCKGLRRSGCVMLKLGIESGDQGVLDSLNKGISLGVAEKALGALHEAEVATYVYLLFGTPPEDLGAARATKEFVLRSCEAIGFLNLAIFNLPLDSQDGLHLAKKEFYEGDLSLYAGFEHPLGWDRRAVRDFLDREFKREPAIAAILRRDPPLFTSNHAPFFTRGFSFPLQ